MAGGIWTGTVTRSSAAGVFVQVPKLSGDREHGPLAVLSCGELAPGDRVAVGLLEGNSDRPIVVGRLGSSASSTPGPAPGTGAAIVFATPAATWTVTNPLPYDPAVTVVVDGEEMLADVARLPNGAIVVTHAMPRAGVVYLS